MESATFGGKTVILPTNLKRISCLEEGQRVQFCNGWGYTALVMSGESVEGYCCIKDKLDSRGNWAGKEIDSND